jgi:hypothetical protein
MSKHTPGPWVASENTASRGGSGEVCIEVHPVLDDKYAYRGQIAYIQSSSCITDGITLEEAIANARLIAQAPRLLEALESIAEYWNQDGNDLAMFDACCHAIDTARAAIAAATGL